MRNLPYITKQILTINIVVWLLDSFLLRSGVDLSRYLGLHFVTASQFYIWQPFTYMFMHANLQHIFFNMFAVFMFAPSLENAWGSKKFLTYYLISGVGAAIVQEITWAFSLQNELAMFSGEALTYFTNQFITIGASGAVFGILFAFGWLFPNVEMFIMFIPIPIRARTLVIGYAVIELLAGISNRAGDNVAHFAHLGGMLFGWLVILWWKYSWRLKSKNSFRFNQEDDDDRDGRFSNYHYRRNIDDD